MSLPSGSQIESREDSHFVKHLQRRGFSKIWTRTYHPQTR